ncbi:MAG: sensory box protein [Promethearchaeota archaeon CR_4]|nr:MAG: sensory box protein [Candidatus Lokiarchaeota archaeon CR_4]
MAEQQNIRDATKKVNLTSGSPPNFNFNNNVLFQTVMELSPFAIIIADLEVNIMYVSYATLSLGGFTDPKEMIGKSAFDFIHPDDHARARENLQKRIQTGFTGDINYTFVRNDKSQFPGELRITILRDEKGQPMGFLAILRDLTEIQESLEKFRFVFENVPVGIGISGETGEILLANKVMHKIFDIPPGRLISANVKDFYVNSRDRDLVKATLAEKGVIVDWEVEFKRSTGTKFWSYLTIKKLEFSGKTTFITTITDITERKKAEASLQELYQEAIKVSDMKTEIITNASHELKTPLIPILGWSDFILNAKLKGLDLNEVIKTEELESILRNVIRLQRIVDDFLDVGRIQSQKLSLDYESVSLQELTRAALRAITQLAQSRQIIVHNDLEEVQLFVDGFRIEQLLVNLLSNACKYSPEKSNVWIRSYTAKEQVEITVEDEGFGFTPDELKDALQPFSPSFLHGKSSQMFSGTGVGLYICKGIVEQHGGKITLSSSGKNKGTKVTISLPLKSTEIRNEIPKEPPSYIDL